MMGYPHTPIAEKEIENQAQCYKQLVPYDFRARCLIENQIKVHEGKARMLTTILEMLPSKLTEAQDEALAKVIILL